MVMRKLSSGIVAVFFFIFFLQGIRLWAEKEAGLGSFCNTGSAFGLAVPSSWILFLGACALFFLALQWWEEDFLHRQGIFLVLVASGISNLWERFRYGCVSDYFFLGFSFNLADTFLTFGVFSLLLSFARQSHRQRKRNKV